MGSISQELQETLNAYKSVMAANPLEAMTPEFKRDWNLSMNFVPYNLKPVAIILVPVITPFRNMTTRTDGKGSKAEYKAVTGINTGHAKGLVAEGAAATVITTSTADFTSTYKSFGLGDKVTFESQWAGRGYYDAKAQAVVNLLRATMIAEENADLFYQNDTASATEMSPGLVGASPQPTLAAAGTDGSIAAATYYIKQTVVTGFGESLPSTATAIAVGATQHITITPAFPASQPALGFKFYWSASSGGTYSEITDADISGGAASDGVLPGDVLVWYTNGTAINVLSLTAANAAPPAADGSGDSRAYNGLVPMMFKNGNSNLKKVNGALTVAAMQSFFKTGWTSYRADYDMVMCHATESIKVTSLTLGNGTPYYVVVDQTQAATANFRVARFTNPVTGSEVPIKVHPTIPQGFMLALSTKMPPWYVPTDIPNIWDKNLPQDYVEIDYPPTAAAPYWQAEVRLFGAMRLYVPQLIGGMYCINNA